MSRTHFSEGGISRGEAGLKAVRSERGLTCAQAALLARTDKGTISRYERGLAPMSAVALVNLSKALKVSIERLTTGNGA